MASFFLIFLCLFPFFAKKLLGQSAQSKLGPLLFIGVSTSVGLSVYSFLVHKALTLTVEVPDFASFGLLLDPLSGIMITCVLIIGTIINQFSVNYLSDDEYKNKFLDNLAMTQFFVFLMLLSPNLGQLFVSWLGISFFLHRLLVHFGQREGALKAARQKFWISRLGDFFILGATGILFYVFQHLDFSVINSMALSTSYTFESRNLTIMASLLLVLGVMTKSAQFPFHYWLPNTMETPTPVSALMHAGILNAGGYLVIRLSSFLSSVPLSLSLLTFIGALTVLWGSLMMFSQTNVKKSLAYSTIAQMGFMMFQCGVGAFSIAVVHIVGHAFYKSYSFLNSGTTTDFSRLKRYYPTQMHAPRLAKTLSYAGFALVIILSSVYLLSSQIENKLGALSLFFVLSLAIAQIYLYSNNLIQAFKMSLSIVASYIALSFSFSFLLKDSVFLKEINFSGFDIALIGFSLLMFAALYLIQNNLQIISKTKLGKTLYVRSLS